MSTTARPPAEREQMAISGRESELEALTGAVAKHAKLMLLAEQLPSHIAAAAEAVDECYRVLGLDPPTAKRRTPAGARQRALRPGSSSAKVLDALRALGGSATSAALSEALDVPVSKLSVTLAGLVQRGHLTTTPGPNGAARGQTYHLPAQIEPEGA